jgi:mono/diheme cytochrome c family protein
MKNVRCSAVTLAVWLLGAVACAHAAEVDFTRDVRPLLNARCVRCHGADKQQGGLRLDDRAHALAGGESGKLVIETPASDNELWRRVASPMAEVRMPLEGDPLSDEELSRLRAWVDAGAPWPDEKASKTPPSFWMRIDPYLRAWDPWVARIRPALAIALVVLIAMLIVQRSARTKRITGASYLLVVLAVVLSGAWVQQQLQREHVQRLQEQIAALDKRVLETRQMYAPAEKLVRPLQPPGVRRTYYRGNDERSPKLFNGGYYRTATIDLTLADSSGEEVAIGEASAGPLALLVDFRRARQAAPALFTNNVAVRTILSRALTGATITDRAAQIVPLEIVTEGEHWRATLPLGEIPSTGALTGRWYVLHGENPEIDKLTAPAHYGIEYDLRFKEGVLQAGSDLWMAPLLYPSNTIATPPHHLHTTEWLDFRPLPEIEGDHVTDPALIGLPPAAPAPKNEAP